MISNSTFDQEAMSFIKEHGFDRFFIYGIKRKFIREDEIVEYAEYILDELIYNENYEDCAILSREIEGYKERKACGFSLLNK